MVQPTPAKVVTHPSVKKLENQVQPTVAVVEEKESPKPPAQPEIAPPPKVEVQPPVDGCGDNEYAHFIYMKESGCRTTAVNSIGCRGIGQACPGSKLPCGDDYACQNAWFTTYALERYGSWANAHAFWLQHSWW